MREIFDRIEAGSIVASPITLADCLVSPIRLGQNELSREYIDFILGREEIIFEYGFEESIAI